MVLDGVSGDVIRTFYLRHEVYAVTCVEDLGGDGKEDCVVSGRAAVS